MTMTRDIEDYRRRIDNLPYVHVMPSDTWTGKAKPYKMTRLDLISMSGLYRSAGNTYAADRIDEQLRCHITSNDTLQLFKEFRGLAE